MAQAAKAQAQAATTTTLLDDIVSQSKVARSDAEHTRAKDIIAELVREVLKGEVVVLRQPQCHARRPHRRTRSPDFRSAQRGDAPTPSSSSSSPAGAVCTTCASTRPPDP